MTKAERAARRTHWRAIIEKQAASGLSIAAFCRDAGIKPSYFHARRRKLREEQPGPGSFLELIPGRLTNASTGVRIRLGAKLVVEVERGFDARTLRDVVEAVGDLPQCSA